MFAGRRRRRRWCAEQPTTDRAKTTTTCERLRMQSETEWLTEARGRNAIKRIRAIGEKRLQVHAQFAAVQGRRMLLLGWFNLRFFSNTGVFFVWFLSTSMFEEIIRQLEYEQRPNLSKDRWDSFKTKHWDFYTENCGLFDFFLFWLGFW